VLFLLALVPLVLSALFVAARRARVEHAHRREVGGRARWPVEPGD
jgi:hypothetical protein